MDPESVVIRRAVAEDAAQLADFAERCFRGTFKNDIRPPDMTRYVGGAFGEAIQCAEIVHPEAVILLAVAADEIVGYAHVRRNDAPVDMLSSSQIELKRFYVAREWHGQGLARPLMNSVIEVAETFGGDLVWLAVWEWNSRAISFYTKSRFVDAGTHPFVLGDEEQTDRVMVRRLAHRPGLPESHGRSLSRRPELRQK